jgi:hypothetical protein
VPPSLELFYPLETTATRVCVPAVEGTSGTVPGTVGRATRVGIGLLFLAPVVAAVIAFAGSGAVPGGDGRQTAAAGACDGQSSTSRSTAGVVVDSGAAEPNPRAEPKRYTLPSSVST